MKKKEQLKIKTIRYSRLKNLGDFENERVEIEVVVAKGSDGHDELLRAKQWTTLRLGVVSDKRYSSNHGPVCVCDECM